MCPSCMVEGRGGPDLTAPLGRACWCDCSLAQSWLLVHTLPDGDEEEEHEEEHEEEGEEEHEEEEREEEHEEEEDRKSVV